MAGERNLDELLVHADWLHRLATRLVGEDGEDLLQDTWVAAVRKPPAGEARPWLTEVLRNFARRRWRTSAARRRTRETVVEIAADDAAASPEDLLARAQLQRTLADLVLGLEEPFRSTILLRYFEGKSGAEIARALGVPAGTVRWRLKEGLDRLRRQLDVAHGGDRNRWRALAAPLVLAGAGIRKGLMLMAMTSKQKVMTGGGVALLLAVLASLFAVFGSGGRGSPFSLGPGPPAPPAPHVRLPEGGQASGGIEGVVKDPVGRTVAGALVSLSRARRAGDVGPGRPAAMATTNGQGRFAFADAWSGTYQVQAAARGFRAGRSAVVTLAPGKQQAVEVRLGEGGVTLSGRVLDEGGGPIPGAVVAAGLGYPWYAAPSPGGRIERQAVAIADDQGRYELTLDPREYALRATAPGYVPAHSTVAVTRSVGRDLRLRPAARVSGRVIDKSTGDPVAEAEVILAANARFWEGHRNTRTDPEGRFVIDDADAGAFTLVAQHREKNLFGELRQVITVATQAVEGLEIAVSAGVRMTGRVRDASGRPLAAVPVVVWMTDWEVMAPGRAVSGPDGGFSIAMGGPGRFRLTAEASGPGDPRGEVTVAVGPKGLDGVELVLASAPEPTPLVGRVLAVDGRPVPGALVRAEATGPPRGRPLAGVETEQDGSFRLVGLPAKDVTLVAWHPSEGFAEQALAGGALSVPVDVRLGRGATIGGVVKFDDGAPAAGISVAVTRQEGTVVYDSDTTDTAGRFALRSLAPGRYTVQATRKRGPGNLWTSREEPHLKLVALAADEQKLDVELSLKRGGRLLAGTARLPDGHPAAGALIVANKQDAAGRSWKPLGSQADHRATTDDDGRWRIEDVEDDTFTVWASLPGLPDAEAAGARAGREDVALAFDPGARLAGVVVGSDGRPVANFHIAAIPAKVPDETPAQRDRRSQASQMPATRVRASDGAFSVDGLQAGSYEVKVTTAEGEAGALETFTVARGEQRTGLRITVGSGARANGRVLVLESGAPVPGATVFSRAGGRRLEAKTGADGSYSLEGLVPGEEVMIQVMSVEGLAGLGERIGEIVELSVPKGVATFDVPPMRLMKGNWRSRDGHGGPHMRVRVENGRPLISSIASDGPAAAAGLKKGDFLLAVDGQDVTKLGPGAISYLTSKPVGTKLNLTVATGAGEQRTVVVPVARP